MKSFELRRILVPTDLSGPAEHALRYAKLLSLAAGAHVDVVYVDPILPPPIFLETGSTIPDIAPIPSREKALEARVRDAATAILGTAAPYTIHVREGAPVPMLLRTADELAADLVVLGTRALHGWRRMLFGSLTPELAHALSRPLLAVREIADAPPPRIAKILCPVNLTAAALDALRVSQEVASMTGAELRVVHAVEDARDAAEAPMQVRRWLEQNGFGGISVQSIVVRGDAAERVLDCVEDLDADLLIIGAQHRLFANETVVGTTTERLLRLAPCPVLTVPCRTPVSAIAETVSARSTPMW